VTGYFLVTASGPVRPVPSPVGISVKRPERETDYSTSGAEINAWRYNSIDRGSMVRFPAGAPGPTQPTIQWIPGALPLGVKLPGRETDHSPPCSAEVKSAWSYTSSPPISLHGVVLS
jgi:hypothetical protein